MKFNAMFEAKIRNMTGEVTFCLLVGVVDSKVTDLLKVFLYITGLLSLFHIFLPYRDFPILTLDTSAGEI